MTTIKAAEINQLLDGRRVKFDKYQDMKGHKIKSKPFSGYLNGAAPTSDNRVFVQVRMDNGEHNHVFLPSQDTLEIDLEGPRYGRA